MSFFFGNKGGQSAKDQARNRREVSSRASIVSRIVSFVYLFVSLNACFVCPSVMDQVRNSREESGVASILTRIVSFFIVLICLFPRSNKKQ